jgi:hypothetical protein
MVTDRLRLKMETSLCYVWTSISIYDLQSQQFVLECFCEKNVQKAELKILISVTKVSLRKHNALSFKRQTFKILQMYAVIISIIFGILDVNMGNNTQILHFSHILHFFICNQSKYIYMCIDR